MGVKWGLDGRRAGGLSVVWPRAAQSARAFFGSGPRGRPLPGRVGGADAWAPTAQAPAKRVSAALAPAA